MSQENLDLTSSEASGPVECLGQTFPSNEARREHYTELLREKLKDPEFRKIEGFPIGEDEDILNLSDPPYYTACPNPWIGEFIEHHGRPYDPKEKYHREPFAADVSEGKGHAIYKVHSYHTKVPHRAIMRYILHYTNPGDVVLDGFSGSGMTGVAANLCANENEIKELGYLICDSGNILDKNGKQLSKTGSRNTILGDLSPLATFIGSNYNDPVDAQLFQSSASSLMELVINECGWMYETKHSNCEVGQIEYTVWSEVFLCPECSADIIFLNEGFDHETQKVKDSFPCHQCETKLTKRNLEQKHTKQFDSKAGRILNYPERIPTQIAYKVGANKYTKIPDLDDLEKIRKISNMELPENIPIFEFPDMQMCRVGRMKTTKVEFAHQLFLPRAAHTCASLWRIAKATPNSKVRNGLLFFVEQAIWTMTVLNRYRPSGFSQVNQFMSGVFYVPSQHSEPSPQYVLEGKLKRLTKALKSIPSEDPPNLITTQDCSAIQMPNDSVDYIFTDPPFGENIYYSDLNTLIESWHKVRTNPKDEAIIDRVRRKALQEYQMLMQNCFETYYRVLKPGRWITVEFSNSKASVWNAIQTTLQEAGFVVATVAALDKQQHTFQAVVSPTAVKQDLVISAYKPDAQLELNFEKHGKSLDGVWDFITNHLNFLPVLKFNNHQLEHIVERDPRILYDRTVAFYVAHNTPVPLSSAEFQATLADKFPERDGMIFLHEQVEEYDKNADQMEGLGQMSIFVEDEKSAINWLRNHLKNKPSSYQDIQPDFMQQLSASWKKFESRPELSSLLEQNFIKYDGTGDVPSQIHGYLSTNFKNLRGKGKDDTSLQSKAKDRWYVPDPKKAVDVEAVRNKRLLTEFWSYLPAGYTPPQSADGKQIIIPGLEDKPKTKGKAKKLKEVRTEAVRVGFAHCFKQQDYATILAVAEQLPNNVVEEDEQLQMIYDVAEMRSD